MAGPESKNSHIAEFLKRLERRAIDAIGTGRAGGRRPQLREERALVMGAGVTVDRLSLDYGWEPLRDGAGHRLTVRLR